MSLYDELGVKKEADAAEIRRAYRKKASKTHPDKGGSSEAFQRVQHAYALLTDPARRQRYDETGQDNELPSIQTAAQQQLAGIIIGLVEAEEKNILVRAREIILNGKRLGQEGIKGEDRKIQQIERTLKKLVCKEGATDFLRVALETLLQQHKASREIGVFAIAMGDEMLKLLVAYEYEVEIELPSVYSHFQSFANAR